jgi:hypothetical protein
MSFKLSTKPYGKSEYSKVYLKLICLEFDTKKVEVAKKYYNEHYKELCVVLNGEWMLDN